MGKANRNKRANQEALEAKQANTAGKKTKSNKFIAILCTVLVVVLLGSLVAYSSLVTSGYFLRNTVVATTENLAVDNAVFSYFFNKYYQEFTGTYGYYLPIDPNVSLKGQACSLYSDGTTWFEFFAGNAQSNLANTLAFCEEAKARGIALDEEDYKDIDDAIASIKDAAKQAGVPILCCMGTGNKLDAGKFRIADISKTSVCPLARIMRKECAKRGFKNVKVLYSTEDALVPDLTEADLKELPEGRRTIPGSVSFVPSVAGLLIAGEVVKDLIK